MLGLRTATRGQARGGRRRRRRRPSALGRAAARATCALGPGQARRTLARGLPAQRASHRHRHVRLGGQPYAHEPRAAARAPQGGAGLRRAVAVGRRVRTDHQAGHRGALAPPPRTMACTMACTRCAVCCTTCCTRCPRCYARSTSLVTGSSWALCTRSPQIASRCCSSQPRAAHGPRWWRTASSSCRQSALHRALHSAI